MRPASIANAQPLSQYLLDTLRQRSVEDIPEGRSKRLTEARLIGAKLNPFDPTLRRAGAAMEIAAG